MDIVARRLVSLATCAGSFDASPSALSKWPSRAISPGGTCKKSNVSAS